MRPMTPTPTLTAGPQIQSVLRARFLAPVLSGEEPHVRVIDLSEAGSLDFLVDIGPVEAEFHHDDVRQLLIQAPTALMYAYSWQAGAAVEVRAAAADDVDKAVVEIEQRCPVHTNSSLVPFDFWQVANHAFTSTRRIEAPAWDDIAGHYPLEVGAAVRQLIGTPPMLDEGRIVLWHGPPGTGKTTAIRSLARAWSDTHRFQVVLDPDEMLARSSLLMQVLLDDNGDDDGARWRVLVIEDADELLREDAKQRVGQALSRLLNLGDGILGQGVKVLVLITTNEPMRRLHPALTRPGRCFAETEFRRFSRSEAVQVFGPEVPAGDELSLADIKTGRPASTAALPGLYL